ncbi:MAG: hypothetical protein JO027_20990 [Solirubrobacterales bacterium]|nr:hypothetical protein [Solirubrobacterales bacterium]
MPSTLRRGRSLALWRPRIRASQAQTLLALGIYLGLACFITWPLPLHPGSRLFGDIGGDLSGGMSYYRVLAHAHTLPFLPGTVHGFNAPEGRATQWTLNFSTLPSSLLLWLSTIAIGPVATFAFWGILTFTLTGLSMFLFIRWLTGNWQAGIVAGLAFGFWPIQFVAMNQPLGDSWVLVLFIWRMLVTFERPTVRNGLWAGAATVLALMWVQYFLLMAGVTWAVLVVCALVLGWKRHELRLHVRTQIAAAIPVLIAAAVLAGVGLATSFSGVPNRGTAQLVQYSARPTMYLLPDPDNPFLGALTKPIIVHEYFSNNSTVNYENIYLGISVMLLSAAGIWVLVRSIRRRGIEFAMTNRATVAAVSLSIAGLVALAFSAPPQVNVAGVNIPMPNDLVAQVTTAFRTTARFAEIVMFALCVLTGIALAELLPRIKKNSTRLLVATAIGVIVTCDLWARPPYRISHINPPSIYHVLAQQPPGVYAEYPLQDGYDFPDSYAAFYQGYAGPHDLFNGYFPGTESESRKLELSFLLAKYTVPELSELGVRYLLVDREAAPPALYPRPGASIPGAQLIASDHYSSLYRITAAPAVISNFATSGFAPPAHVDPGIWHWMNASTAEIEIRRQGSLPRLFEVSFSAGSFRQPRHLRITDDSGRVLYSGVISPTDTQVSLYTTIAQRKVLHLSISPAPVSPHSLDPSNPITWTLGLLVSDPLTVRPVQ